MSSFHTPILALLLAVGATTSAAALDQQAPGLRASCQTLLAGISASPYSIEELAALCRARAPSNICRDALSSLGQKPWAPARVSETCRRWEQDLEQRMLEMSPDRSAQTRQDLQRSLQQKDQAGTCAGGKPLEQCIADKASDSPGGTDKLQNSMHDKTMPPRPVIGGGSTSGGKTGLGGIKIGNKGVDAPQATTVAPDSIPAGTTVTEGTSGPGSSGDTDATPATTAVAGSDPTTTVADAGATTVGSNTVPATAGAASTTASEAGSDATTTAAAATDSATMTSSATSISADAAGTTTSTDANATVTEPAQGGILGKIGGRGTKDVGGTKDAAGKSLESPKKMLTIKVDDAEEVTVKVEFHKKLSLQPTARVAGLVLTGLVAMAAVAGVASSVVRKRRPVHAHRLSSLYASSSDVEDKGEEPINELLLH